MGAGNRENTDPYRNPVHPRCVLNLVVYFFPQYEASGNFKSSVCGPFQENGLNPSYMAKRATTLLILLIFVLAALAMFLAGYLISKKSLTGGQNQQALIGDSLVSRFQEAPEKRVPPTGLFALSRDRAAFPMLSADGKEILYYNPDSGEIRSVSTQNMAGGSTLAAKIQPAARQASWGLNKTLVATFPSNSIFYDLNSNTSKKLDSKIKKPVLSRAGDKLAYNYFDTETGKGNIGIADPEVGTFKIIMPTRFENWRIDWVSKNVLSLIRHPTPENPAASLFTLDIETGALRSVVDFKPNLEVVWSPSGQKIIYSYNNDPAQESNLYFMDLSSREEVELNITLDASKCTWGIDNKTVYCAGKDSFVTINTSSTSPIPENIPNIPKENLDSSAIATNLLLTSTEDYLIFRNSQNGKLYGLSLNQ